MTVRFVVSNLPGFVRVESWGRTAFLSLCTLLQQLQAGIAADGVLLIRTTGVQRVKRSERFLAGFLILNWY